MNLLFLDLDDTLFQTHRKNTAGKHVATETPNPYNTSYMTDAQAAFLDLFVQNEQFEIIPVTARDHRQYRNTLLSRNETIRTAVMYFGGLILRDGEADKSWHANIQSAYQKLSMTVADVFEQFNTAANASPEFKLFDVDGYYATIKATPDCPVERREEVFSQLRSLANEEYFLHENGRALSLLPNFIDKSHAVAWLIEQYQPTLTIGAGDSLTDLPFMHLCDFRMFPRHAQIEQLMVPS
ncbi:MAG: HAD family hydrolase [Pseudomonadota bacterium]